MPANVTLLTVNGASSPRDTTFDHHLSPGGWLPRVNVWRSWANPIVQTYVFLDPTVRYEYALLPVLADPLKVHNVSFLTVCDECPVVPSAGGPVLGSSGAVRTEAAGMGGEAAGGGQGSSSGSAASSGNPVTVTGEGTASPGQGKEMGVGRPTSALS